MERIKVVLSSAVTYLVAAGVAVAVFADQASAALPDGWQDNAVQVGGIVVGVIGAAVSILYRVIEVVPADRGLVK